MGSEQHEVVGQHPQPALPLPGRVRPGGPGAAQPLLLQGVLPPPLQLPGHQPVLRDNLKAGLSEKPQGGEAPDGPTVAELDQQIKALRATNAVQGDVQRMGTKPTRAERPVTARVKPRVVEPVEEEAKPQAVVFPLPVPAPYPSRPGRAATATAGAAADSSADSDTAGPTSSTPAG